MKIYIQRRIKADASVLWNYLSDYSNIYQFHPLLKSSGYIEDSCISGNGATRQCYMLDGNYLKERVIDWSEGKYYTVDVYETTLPVKSAKTTMGVAEIEPGLSITYMHMDIKPKYAILRPVLYVMFRFMAGPSVLRGLEKMATAKNHQNINNLQAGLVR